MNELRVGDLEPGVVYRMPACFLFQRSADNEWLTFYCYKRDDEGVLSYSVYTLNSEWIMTGAESSWAELAEFAGWATLAEGMLVL